ncbi:colicin E3-like toxin immunity protein [Symbiopectobacterium purcellii]|uniref:Tail fiber protein n=1 Tax=Symbiopectobacterium purcellii TaxID=2871826 RepID=A0ABX9AM17_9ENTR|nr:colicin E3-like toxin immunity protein [Symbiopectobacterium purcellii]QZN94055.1 tail fiber protein [Symbiopectobacterium purcellii]
MLISSYNIQHKEKSKNLNGGMMGVRVRIHWFDRGKTLSVGRECSADLGNDNTIFKSISLAVAHNVNNGNFPVEKHWVEKLQPLFFHWIDLEHYDYQVAFDYKDKWNINENSLRGRNVMTMQFISVDELAGIPLPYPLATPPAGWFICQGQVFDKTKYPKLAHCYPTGRLPDLRGEFIRGWDNARGADTGRLLLSEQGDAIRNITGKFANNGLAWSEGASSSVGEGTFTRLEGYLTSNNNVSSGGCHYTFDASKVVPTATENRPRNIAFNYIVRAI